MDITIQNARREQAPAIARLIMAAMNHDCCQWFAGPAHTLSDFHAMMCHLVEDEHSQYSYLNTLTAIGDHDMLMGICTSYDGGRLHSLRKAFIEAARTHLERDFSDMDDETGPGELYLDSLAVEPQFRCQGVATRLLTASIEKGRKMGLPAVGLLVDQGNPAAERLYRSVGFQYVEDSTWGGHPMRHLQVRF